MYEHGSFYNIIVTCDGSNCNKKYHTNGFSKKDVHEELKNEKWEVRDKAGGGDETYCPDCKGE